jgi:hypothetical protein
VLWLFLSFLFFVLYRSKMKLKLKRRQKKCGRGGERERQAVIGAQTSEIMGMPLSVSSDSTE